MKTAHRFFLPKEYTDTLAAKKNGEIFTITEKNLLHQWHKVLRLKKNATITLLDNTDKEYEITVQEITAEKSTVKIMEITTTKTEPRTKITLYQAIPKQLEKLKWVIQKGTELGASAFVPLITERTVLRTVNQQKMRRLEMIAKESAEQSERGIIPAVHQPTLLANAVKNIAQHKPHELILCTDARENKNQLREFEIMLKAAKNISIFIGPEGGLSSQEIDFLKQEGAQCVQLGARILRTETAGLALLAGLFVGGLIE